MLTTKNIYKPETVIVTAADRMAKARAAKLAKAQARGATTGGPPPRASKQESRAEAAQTPEQTITILRELQQMYLIGSKPYELATKALRLVEAQMRGDTPGGKHETKGS